MDKQIMATRACEVWLVFSLPLVQTKGAQLRCRGQHQLKNEFIFYL